MTIEFGSEKKGIEILIVEDSLTQAEQLKYLLENKGFGVAHTRNGVEALIYLNTHLPHLIISDIIMPEMDGFQLCKKVKQDEQLKDIPIILLTTLSEPEDVVKGLDCRADNFLTKPYDEELLISRIHYLLLNKELRKTMNADIGLEIIFSGKRQFITSSRIQILDLLISTYESAILKSRELEKAYQSISMANETIQTLRGLIPICSKCKKIRNDTGFWQQIEEYIKAHADVTFTHGYCPDCLADMMEQIDEKLL